MIKNILSKFSLVSTLLVLAPGLSQAQWNNLRDLKVSQVRTDMRGFSVLYFSDSAGNKVTNFGPNCSNSFVLFSLGTPQADAVLKTAIAAKVSKNKVLVVMKTADCTLNSLVLD